MARISSQKLFLILLVAIVVFFVSLQFYNSIIYFFVMPLTEAISDGVDIPLMTTYALGEKLRTSFKIALFISLISVMLFTDKRIMISFIVGVVTAYILVGFVMFKWLILFSVWTDKKMFSMEDYIGYFILFMIFTGAVFSGVAYKQKRS